MVKSNRHGRSLTEPPWESTSTAGVGIPIGGYQSYTRTWVYAISASAKHSNTASHHSSSHSIQHDNCFGHVVCVPSGTATSNGFHPRGSKLFTALCRSLHKSPHPECGELSKPSQKQNWSQWRVAMHTCSFSIIQVASLVSAATPHSPMWAVRHLQLFTVQRSEEISHLFVLAQCGTQPFSLRCGHRYGSEVSPPSKCLC